MGGAKRLLEQAEEDQGEALSLLLELEVLTTCPLHEDQILEGTEDIEVAYRVANSRITSGKITLREDQTRKDYTDVLKEMYDEYSYSSSCYYCNKDD